MKPSRSSLFLLFPAAVLLGAAAGCGRGATAKAGSAPAVPVQVAVAEQRDVPRRVESIGAVQALRTVGVKSQVDGIISVVHFKEGDDVRVGDPLVTLDRRPFENALLQARAALANAAPRRPRPTPMPGVTRTWTSSRRSRRRRTRST